MLLVKKCQFFVYLGLVKIRLEIILNDFAEKKNLFVGYKKHNFSKSKKSHFSKGVNPWFWTIVYVDLVNITLEIMLGDFPQEKRNLLSHFFLKADNLCFWPKNAIFFFI